MIIRHLSKELSALAKDYPVVTVLGPRQSGKTTLVRALFKNKPYVNLEAPDTRALAELDPRGFFEKYPDGAVLDEIQRVPALLSYIQEIVDAKKQNGAFILTGSHQLELHQAISQSLAGRTALLTLLPLSLGELGKKYTPDSLDEILLKGFFPRVLGESLDPTKAYRNYFQTYIERDVRSLINVKDLSTFQKFIKLCAGRIGQELNMNSLSNDIGISSHTVRHWISILEASFVIFKLNPYFENFGKRVIKSPKLYFVDVGLASYLLDIESTAQISRDPLRGHLFENLVVLELIKSRTNQGKDHQLYYYRDSKQHEVDVLFKTGNQLVPIEIKSSQTINSEFFRGLEYFKKLVGNRFVKGFLVYAGKKEQKIGSHEVMHYSKAHEITR